MKIIKKSPDPFFYEGTNEIAILLIHGFTGSPAELRLLGQFLNSNGYTVYAPLLAGHGKTPEEMELTDRNDWWNSVLDGYNLLKSKGYEKIIAIGLSMGGTLSLKLAMERPLIAVIPIAAPIYVHSKFIGLARWIKYIKHFQDKKGKNAEIEQYIVSYDKTPIACVESLHSLIKDVKGQLPTLEIPLLIMQGKKDETVRWKSARYIYDNVSSKVKELKWYDNSTHIMTLDQERETVFKDILLFVKMFS